MMMEHPEDWDQEYSTHWAKGRCPDADFYHHKTKELAIVQRTDGKWIVIANKKNPRLEAVYDSFDDLFAEWSHA